MSRLLRDSVRTRFLYLKQAGFFESKSTVKRNYVTPGKFDTGVFKLLVKIDPTADHGAKYLDWLAKMYVTVPTFKNDLAEDEQKTIVFVHNQLKQYDMAVSSNYITDKEANIDYFKSVDEFARFTTHSDLDFREIKGVPFNLSNLVEDVDYEVVEENDKAVVFHILTYKASQQLGRPTWCIQKKENYWNDYTTDGAEFYFVFNLKETNSNTNSAWAVAYVDKLYQRYLEGKANTFIEVYDGRNNEDYGEKKMPLSVAGKYLLDKLGLSFSFNPAIKEGFHSQRAAVEKFIASPEYENMYKDNNLPYIYTFVKQHYDNLTPQEIARAEAALAQDPYAAYSYARFVRKSPFPEGEKAILTDTEFTMEYIKSVIQGRWPEGEKTLAEAADASAIYYYANAILKAPFPAGEKILLRDGSAELLYQYALNLKKGRWPEAEDKIAKDTVAAYDYADNVLHGRFPKGEPAIARSSYAHFYVQNVLHGERFPEREKFLVAMNDLYLSVDYINDTLQHKHRVPELEHIISKHSFHAYNYAIDIIKGRFPEGEEAIAKDSTSAMRYAIDIIKGRWPEGEEAIGKYASDIVEYVKVVKDRIPEAEKEILSRHPSFGIQYLIHAFKPGERWPEFEEKLSNSSKEVVQLMVMLKYAEHLQDRVSPELEKIIANDSEWENSYMKFLQGIGKLSEYLKDTKEDTVESVKRFFRNEY